MRALDCDRATSPERVPSSGTTDPSIVALRSLEEIAAFETPEDARVLADWIKDYLMRPHPDLGRTGHVCPFTAKAARLALLRIGISPLGATDRGHILQVMRAALVAFDALPSTRATKVFRTVMIGFPNCGSAEGIETLHAVQNTLRHHSLVGAKMIGLFEPQSQATGLINPAFRPLRSPLPVLAIRMLVEQDAPFVARNPLLAPIYLLKFPLAGPRRLLLHARAVRQRRAGTSIAVSPENRP